MSKIDDHVTPVMRNPKLSTGARLLWWELNQWVTSDLNACLRTQAQMAEDLGVHRNTVIRWLKELRAQGLIDDKPVRYGKVYSLTIRPGTPSVQQP